MAFEKRLCVLKQVKKGFSADGKALSGAVHAERMGGELTLNVRLLDVAPVREGRYALAVWVGGKYFCHDLTENGAFRVTDAPSLKEGFAALLCFVRGEAEPVAYGYCGNAPADYREVLGVFAEEADKKRKRAIPTPMPPNQIPGVPSPQVPLAPAVPLPDEEDTAEDAPFRDKAKYDDEAIASADYFRDGVHKEHEDETASACLQTAKTEESGGGDFHQNEAGGAVRINPQSGTAYYLQIKERLDAAFRTYPQDTRLKAVFPYSEWVNAEGSLLGIIYQQGQPRLLCVAVEANGNPPEEMQESCVRVPASHFDHEHGFYVVFQDAETGEVVKTFSA